MTQLIHILLVQFDIFLTQLYISVAHTNYIILNQLALPTCSRRGKNEVRYILRIGPEGGRVFFIILYQSYEHFKYQTNMREVQPFPYLSAVFGSLFKIMEF